MKKLVLALAAVAMIATPVLADVTPYGSARVALVYIGDDTKAAGVGTSTSALDLVLQGNSRLGIKASTGDVTGRVELGALGGTAVKDANGVTIGNASALVYTRLLYGTVKLGEGTFLVGQAYTKNTKFSNQALNNDLGFIGFGALYDGRQPQLTYTMDNGFYFMAAKNGKKATDGDYIPKLGLGYSGKAGGFKYTAGLHYQKYESALLNDVSSYMLFVCGDWMINDGMTLLYGVHYGQNLGDYGIQGRSDSASFAENATTTEDATNYGLMLELDMSGFAFGVGYTADENKLVGPDTNAQMALFVNYTAQIAKGFKIVPEITYVDYMDDADGLSDGTLLLAGAKFQMDF